MQYTLETSARFTETSLLEVYLGDEQIRLQMLWARAKNGLAELARALQIPGLDCPPDLTMQLAEMCHSAPY
jgi:hypothetical protein